MTLRELNLIQDEGNVNLPRQATNHSLSISRAYLIPAG